MTTVVNMKREPCDIKIDRSGPYGNRFVIGVDGNRNTVIELHMREWRKFLDNPSTRPLAISCLQFMKGKRLGCHCTPKECHGDNYVKLIAEVCS